MTEERSTKFYISAVLAAGLVCVTAAAAWLPLELFDLKFVLLAALTLAIGSRVTIPIPRFKSHIAVSDTFIFLVLLLYGGEYAILLSAVEAFASSWRFCNKRITVFFNAATMAVSTTSVVLALKLLGLYSERQPHSGVVNGTNFVFALRIIQVHPHLRESFLSFKERLNKIDFCIDGILLIKLQSNKTIHFQLSRIALRNIKLRPHLLCVDDVDN